MAPSHRCIGLLTIMSMIACVISCADDTKRRGAAQRGFLVRTSTRNWACCAFVAGAKGPDVCLTMKPVGKPDAGNPHVRFDERGGETERLPKGSSHRALPRLYPRLDLCTKGRSGDCAIWRPLTPQSDAMALARCDAMDDDRLCHETVRAEQTLHVLV